MYGMVNRALVDMVQSEVGTETWDAIAKKAEISDDLFLSMSQYGDDVTYRLVGATSEVLGMPAEQVLQNFGSFWIQYTAREGYGELMRVAGNSIWEFLANLDNLHARVGLSFQNLKPPSFRCSHRTERSVLLHYRSSRAGLAHLVIGLLKGLGEMFHTPVRVTRQPPRPGETPVSDEVFLVEQVD